MQAPALFLVAAISLLAGAWSSDSGYQQDTQKLADEANVAYRNDLSAPVTNIVQVEKTSDKPLMVSDEEQPVAPLLLAKEELVIPVFNKEDQMLDSIGQNNCNWMDRVNQMEEEAIVINQNVEEPSVVNWKSDITKNAARIGESLFRLSNNTITAIIEIHQYRAETRLSASPQENAKH